jgi:hypothetical protein
MKYNMSESQTWVSPLIVYYSFQTLNSLESLERGKLMREELVV